MVNLSGRNGDRLKQGADWAKSTNGRFVVFANLDFSNIDEPGYGKRAAAQLEQDVKNGAQGLKFFKNFGMDLKDGKGERIHVDDPRFDPVFETCARLKIPVLIHTADPRQFWEPVGQVQRALDRTEGDPGPPPRPLEECLLGDADRRAALAVPPHPNRPRSSTPISAGSAATWPGSAACSTSARTCTPRSARCWPNSAASRASHAPSSSGIRTASCSARTAGRPEEYPYYFRVLETADEYFDYYRKRHAFWKMYGLELPDEVLKKLYYKNALRIIPGLDASGFPQ